MFRAGFLYSILFSCSVAMLLFVVGFISFELGFSWLTSWLYGLAGKILLLAFALFLLAGAVLCISALLSDFRHYFNPKMIALRHIWSIHSKQQTLEQRANQQCRQLLYFSQFKRQRLLVANNRKQLQELYTAIYKELQQAKSQLPPARYQAMHQALRRYRQQADTAAMLAIRQQLV